jgi:flagellar motor switch protein FliM
MVETLTQNEVDALLSALTSGELETEVAESREPTRRVKRYDFMHPERFSKDQTRTLEMLHDQFARLFATSLSSLMRNIVEVRLVSIEQLAYHEFIQSIPKPTSINIIGMQPLNGKAVVEFSPSLCFTVIDRLMGGSGTNTSRNRELTDIEKALMRKVLDLLLEGLATAWKSVIELEPTVEAMETNPHISTQLFMPSEMVILLTFELGIAGHTGTLSICIPFVVLEPVGRQLSSRSWFSATRKDITPEIQTSIQQNMRRVTLPVRVVLGESELSMREITDLRVGDVIPLSRGVNEDIDVLAGESVRLAGRPGVHRSNRAVQICAPSQTPYKAGNRRVRL